GTASAAPVARGLGPRARFVAAAAGKLWLASASSRRGRRGSPPPAARFGQRPPRRSTRRLGEGTSEVARGAGKPGAVRSVKVELTPDVARRFPKTRVRASTGYV